MSDEMGAVRGPDPSGGAARAAGTQGPPPAEGRASRRRRLRRLLLAGVGVLYLFSVPWYRAPDAAPPLWFGLPSWVAVALGCYAVCAVLNSLAWQLTDVPDTPERDAHGELGGPRT